MDQYDLWNSTTKKKIAFDVTHEVVLHWLHKLVTDNGRQWVREHVKMMHWPAGVEMGHRFTGRELLDFLDLRRSIGCPETA